MIQIHTNRKVSERGLFSQRGNITACAIEESFGEVAHLSWKRIVGSRCKVKLVLPTQRMKQYITIGGNDKMLAIWINSLILLYMYFKKKLTSVKSIVQA